MTSPNHFVAQNIMLIPYRYACNMLFFFGGGGVHPTHFWQLRYVDCENISGIFIDDSTNVAHFCMYPPHGTLSCTGPWTFTEADQRAFSNATFQHLDQALTSMDARGKTAIVSTDIGAAPLPPSPLTESAVNAMLLQHGALHFSEYFYGGEAEVQAALKLVAAGNPFMVHSIGK